MCDVWKITGRRAERSEIWDSGILVMHIWCNFDLVVFKVIFGSFGGFVSKCTVSQKRLVGLRAKRNEIWDSLILWQILVNLTL